VRLAALDLREISEVDLEGSGVDPGIPGFPCFSPKFTCFLTFLLNVTFLCKLRRSQCRCRVTRRLHDVPLLGFRLS